MIKLKNLIMEGRSEDIELSDVITLLRTNNASNKFPRIYRGLRNRDDYLIVKPSKYNRVSANTGNYYTILLDNLPSWKEYPKRSRSIIGTTDYNYANQYGIVYRVIPTEGSTIGICPSEDIWESFSDLSQISLSGFNDILARYIKIYNSITGNNITGNSYDELVYLFKYIQENDNFIDEISEYDRFLIDLWLSDGKNMEIIQYLDTVLLNPKVNGFKLTTYPYKNSFYIHDHEVWTDGDCILISDNYADNILDKL